MNDQPDENLRRLLHDAVDGVQPADRIAQIRAQTQGTGHAPWRRRTAVAGAVFATAAAVAAVAVLPGVLSDAPDPGVATAPTATQGASVPSRTESPPLVDPSLKEPESPSSVPAYFVGDTPRGPRLYRYFTVVDGSQPRLLAALKTLENLPGDPDYRSLWPREAFVGAEVTLVKGSETGKQIVVDLADESFADLPAGWDQERAGLALQQAVYTAQGAVGEGRLPVRFTADTALDSVFGIPTDEPITNASVFETLSLMSISYPFQGAEISGSFRATGVNNSFESTVIWRIEDEAGDVVDRGFTTAEGWIDERLYPWETEIDVSELPPGGYTFIAENDDPTGGTEGNGPDSDTRLIVIE